MIERADSDVRVLAESSMPENPQLARNISHFAVLTQRETEEFECQRRKVQLIKRTLAVLPTRGSLADVGCFTGIATQMYGSLGFLRVVGFDVSPDALRVASERGIDVRRWVAGDTPCPAEDGEFDVIVAADIIEHLVDTDGFLRELSRILAPSGVVIITTPNLAYWGSRLRLFVGKPPVSSPGASPSIRTDQGIDLNHIRLSTSGEWEGVFRAHGFTVVDTRGWSLVRASHGGIGVQVRKLIDRQLSKIPTLAFGLIFLLRRSDSYLKEN
jgi:SAM-dependent methyltransferase